MRPTHFFSRHKNSHIIFFAVLLLLTFVQLSSATEPSGKKAKSFSVGKGAALEVSISGGDINIIPWNKDEIFVSVEDLDEDELARVEMVQEGNTVKVSYRPKWGSSHGGRFDMSVPTKCDADVHTAGGHIEVRGAIAGTMKGSTSGGDIILNDVSGRAEMKTSGGDVSAKNIDGVAILKTSGGDIHVGIVNGEAEVKTSGGDIEVEKVGKSLKAGTSGGNVRVGDVGGDATLSTAGGDVEVGKVSGKAFLKTAGGGISLRGASGSVEAKTAGGDITLENVSGSIQAKTAGGNIVAELTPSGKGASELSTAGGNIKLSIPENAKAVVDAQIRIRGDGWFGGKKKYDVHSDFKSEKYDKQDDEVTARYIINGGGETITLEAVNGNIDIRKMTGKK